MHIITCMVNNIDISNNKNCLPFYMSFFSILTRKMIKCHRHVGEYGSKAQTV